MAKNRVDKKWKFISKYVRDNAKYLEDAPNNKYFVRFPNPYSTKIFFGEEPADLVRKVADYVETPEGKEKFIKNFGEIK